MPLSSTSGRLFLGHVSMYVEEAYSSSQRHWVLRNMMHDMRSGTEKDFSKTQCTTHCTQCGKPYDCSRHVTGLLAYHLSVCLSQLAINV